MIKEFILLAPIENFNFDVESIDVGNGVQIKRFGDLETSAINDYINQLQSNYRSVGRVGFYSVFTSEETDVDNLYHNLENFRMIIDKEISCLRLFKNGNIGIVLIALFKKEDNNLTHQQSNYWTVYPYYGSGYFLSSAELESYHGLRNLFYRVNVSQTGFWSLAKRRLENSYWIRSIEDKLIDFTIGLEALFSEGPGDLTFKLSTRVARLLGTTKEERRTISSAMKKIYKLRSEIVHGDITEEPDFEINVNRPEEYLRLSLKSTLNLINSFGENKNELLKIIDFGL